MSKLQKWIFGSMTIVGFLGVIVIGTVLVIKGPSTRPMTPEEAMRAAAGAKGAAISYTLNSDPSPDYTTGDQLLGITAPTGSWAINRYRIAQLPVSINSDSNGMSQEEMTAAGMYGTVFFATGAGTWNLPAAATGMSFCLYSTTQAAVIINPDDSDVLVYDGVADTAGHQIAAPNAAVGEFICFVAYDTTNWYSIGHSGTWVPGS